ncbi:signal recognition particle receptor beta subunit-domain-containing protein [Biscogniauxia mediterranea]|nr:signal recognition particle receptor beta subunit-domain-containing protein [Biscogniauxia mediterranea]
MDKTDTTAIMDEFKRIVEYIMTPSTPVFVVGGLIVLLVPLLIHFLITRTTPYTTLSSIVLAGPPGGGKTSLLTLLERGDAAAPTHTSQAAHAVELTVSTDGGAPTFREAARDDAPGKHRKFLLVDTPGHGKLRGHALGRLGRGSGGEESHQALLKGVVFVVDSAALDDDDDNNALSDAAAYLYDVLLALQRRAAGAGNRSARRPDAVPLLIAANKNDLFTALPAALVKSSLEAELGRIRQSRSKGLLDSGVGADDDVGSEEQDGWLGEYGSEKFSFAQMREFDIDVQVVGGSVLEGQVDKWWDWIAGQI